MMVTLGTFRLNLLYFQPFQDLKVFMANVLGRFMTILRPQRLPPSAGVQVTTVRMYGKLKQHIYVLPRWSMQTM